MVTLAHVRPDLKTGTVTTSIPRLLRHLVQMSDSFDHQGEPITFLYCYARPRKDGSGTLRFIRAQESGLEGVACVDDAARAVLLALNVWETSRSPAALQYAQKWMSFVSYMQDPDGRFTNFILDRTGRKRRNGRTSYPGGQWWTVRAAWASAAMWRVTGEESHRDLFARIRLTGSQDFKVTAVQALALMECYLKEPTTHLRKRIITRCDRLLTHSDGYLQDHRVHQRLMPWGYHQLQAMAMAGRLFSRGDYLRHCERTVEQVVTPLIESEFGHSDPWERAPQCAYDISTLVLGLEELYRATQEAQFHKAALACSDWLYTANSSGRALYEPHIGRCADGVTEQDISSHCGAESAIEAGLVELARRRLQRSF